MENEFDSGYKSSFEVCSDLMVPNCSKWFSFRPDYSQNISPNLSTKNLLSLKREAELLYQKDCKNYWRFQYSNKRKSDIIKIIKSRSTLVDKLAAYTTLIQDSPVHNLSSLKKLLDLVKNKAPRISITTIECMKNLFLAELLPPESELKKFSETIISFNPMQTPNRSRKLIIIYFEDNLRQLFFDFLEILNKISLSYQDPCKVKAVKTMLELLGETKEQQTYLIEKLVNKFGDPIPKIATNIAYLLSKIVNFKRIELKEPIIKETERLIYRSNISERCRYYCFCFLINIVLSRNDQKSANKLLSIYFNFFEYMMRKNNIKNKMMNVLLTGVSRVIPYTDLNYENLNKRLNSFYKILHMVNKNTCIQGLMLIYNVLNKKDCGLITDRFYCVLYRSILDIPMDKCSRKAIYLNLLFKALKCDSFTARINAFIKRLLNETLNQSSSTAPAILMLISELISKKPEIKTNHITSMKDFGSDEEEYYQDFPDLDDIKLKKKCRKKVIETKSKKSFGSWVHSKNINNTNCTKNYYDPFARNPLYANAEMVGWWELNLLKDHFHPSTSLFCQNLLKGEKILYDGDPLLDFSTKRFLERFVFRNPKNIDKNTAQESTHKTVFARSHKENVKFIPISQMLYSSLHKIPFEERFIYEYLKNKEKKEKFKDDASVASEDFEVILDKYESDGKDFSDMFKNKIRKKRKHHDSDSKGSLDDMDIEEDNELEIDSNDEEYQNAFGDIDRELKKAKKSYKQMINNVNVSDESEDIYDDDVEDDLCLGQVDEEEEIPDTSKYKRRGRNKNLMSLYAAADEFSHLMDDDTMDSDEKEDRDD